MDEQSPKRELRTAERLVTANGCPATCPFHVGMRCNTGCALCTEVVDDVIDEEGNVHFGRTNEWQCSLANDGNTLVVEQAWLDGTYAQHIEVEEDLSYILEPEESQGENREVDTEAENEPQ